MSDWFDESASGTQVDVVALMDSDVAVLLWEIVDLGALLSLGRTSDGGALGVTVTVDGRYRREYFRDVEALGSWLAEAVPAVRIATEARSASSGPRQRQRRPRGL